MTKKQKKLIDFIKKHKEIKGICPTQEECARFMGVTQPAISKMFKKVIDSVNNICLQ
jgi:predicted XRE-type DNA-binding protein